MPIYEYECTSCHHHFDLMQKISDAPVKQCPQCFENTAVRLVSAAGFQLKGSGWYVTDFKNNKKSEAKKKPLRTPIKRLKIRKLQTPKRLLEQKVILSEIEILAKLSSYRLSRVVTYCSHLRSIALYY